MKKITFIFLLSAIGFVGEKDFQDEIADQEHYCKMVGAGYWPNYNKSINCEVK